MNLNDPSNYKNCRIKQYECWICKPPVGTVVIDDIIQHDLLLYLRKYLKPLNKRCFLYKNEVDYIKENNPKLYDFLVLYKLITDSNNSMVVCGTLGELSITSYANVKQDYLMYSNETYVNIPKVINERLEKYNDEPVLPWYKAISSTDTSTLKACFVPKNEKIKFVDYRGNQVETNSSNVDHGKGDFVIRDNSGRFKLVNGIVFSNTFDNRGWSNEIAIGRINFDKPTDIFTITSSNKDNSSSSTKDVSPDKVDSSSKNAVSSKIIDWYRSNGGERFAKLLETHEKFLDKAKFVLQKQMSACNYLRDKYSCNIGLETGESFILPDGSNFVDKKYEFDYDIECLSDEYQLMIRADFNDFSIRAWAFTLNEDSNYYEDPYEDFENLSTSEIDKAVDKLTDAPNKNYDTLLEIMSQDECLEDCKDVIKSMKDDAKNAVNNLPRASIISIQAIIDNTVKLYKEGLIETIYAGYEYNEHFRIILDMPSKRDKDRVISPYIELFIEWRKSNDAVAALCHPDINSHELTYEDFIVAKNINNLRKAVNDVANGGDPELQATKTTKSYPADMEIHYDVEKSTIYMEYKREKFRCETSNARLMYSFANEISSIFLDLKGDDCPSRIARYISETYTFHLEDKDYKQIEEREMFIRLMNAFDSYMSDIFLKASYKNDTLKCTSEINAYISILKESKTSRTKCCIVYPGTKLYIPCNISRSTLEVLTKTLPDKVKREGKSFKPDMKFQPLHYHQVIMRLGEFKYLSDYKKLKLMYYKYNEEVFSNKLDNTCSVGIYNYKDTKTDGGEDFLGFNRLNNIRINAHDYNIQNTFSLGLKYTMIHEMCHSYTHIIYGTYQENEGEDGGALGLDEYYKKHWWCHGFHFKAATELVQEKSGLKWQDVFGYGLGNYSEVEKDTGDRRLIIRNAFNSGQAYRKIYSFDLSGQTFCKTHGLINCKCNGTNKLELENGRYLGYCKSCGNVETFDDSNLIIKGVNPSYFDVIDKYGIIYLSKCSKCGQLHMIPIVSDYDENSKYINSYLSDLSFADRYVNHIKEVCEGNLDNYNKYFTKNLECTVKLSRDMMPALNIEIISTEGNERLFKYKFFICCNGRHKPIGKLYRDYGYDYSGYSIHEFRIATDKDVQAFFKSIMTYVKKDLERD